MLLEQTGSMGDVPTELAAVMTLLLKRVPGPYDMVSYIYHTVLKGSKIKSRVSVSPVSSLSYSSHL